MNWVDWTMIGCGLVGSLLWLDGMRWLGGALVLFALVVLLAVVVVSVAFGLKLRR